MHKSFVPVTKEESETTCLASLQHISQKLGYSDYSQPTTFLHNTKFCFQLFFLQIYMYIQLMNETKDVFTQAVDVAIHLPHKVLKYSTLPSLSTISLN